MNKARNNKGLKALSCRSTDAEGLEPVKGRRWFFVFPLCRAQKFLFFPAMKSVFAVVVLCLLATSVFAQVDIEHRRTVTAQASLAVFRGDTKFDGFGYFWFNENNYPWTNTALRVIFAGVYVDSEFSYYVAGNTNTAIGIGVGGGMLVDSCLPYRNGRQLSDQAIDGGDVGGHIFINQTIPNPTPLPLNVRGTYSVYKFNYDMSDSIQNFVCPSDFITQTIQGELRFGGIEPGLLSKRGAEFYVSGDANYRSGFDAFGPVGGPVLGDKSNYDRILASLGAILPAGPVTVGARICGAYGDNIDELSAWKLGGNLINVEPYSYTLHGYYLWEIFSDRFVMSNLALSIPVHEKHNIAIHFYGDWANAHLVPPSSREHNYLGTGAGVSFRGPYKTDVLLSYGYGFNAERNGTSGGHEVTLGLEREF